jgi:hypothetical protein
LKNQIHEVQKWISEHFQNGVVCIEDYPALHHGKKIIDDNQDFVIVFYDEKKDRINYYFKPLK